MLRLTFRTARGINALDDRASFLELVVSDATKRYYRDSEFNVRVEEATKCVENFFVRDDGESFDDTELQRIRVMFSITFYLEELKALSVANSHAD